MVNLQNTQTFFSWLSYVKEGLEVFSFQTGFPVTVMEILTVF